MRIKNLFHGVLGIIFGICLLTICSPLFFTSSRRSKTKYGRQQPPFQQNANYTYPPQQQGYYTHQQQQGDYPPQQDNHPPQQ